MASSSANILNDIGKKVAKPAELGEVNEGIVVDLFERMLVEYELIVKHGTLDEKATLRLNNWIRHFQRPAASVLERNSQYFGERTLAYSKGIFLVMGSTVEINEIQTLQPWGLKYLRRLVKAAKALPGFELEKVRRLFATHDIHAAYQGYAHGRFVETTDSEATSGGGSD